MARRIYKVHDIPPAHAFDLLPWPAVVVPDTSINLMAKKKGKPGEHERAEKDERRNEKNKRK